ncbi:hypothetical protein NEUTE2DRAFT_60243 [Neurospora tetrasperma FGSC 2509]|nr:hypothetical protein NEUTE2DRAFT_60243 [Neurospora tetrasperma FGSC 2509]
MEEAMDGSRVGNSSMQYRTGGKRKEAGLDVSPKVGQKQAALSMESSAVVVIPGRSNHYQVHLPRRFHHMTLDSDKVLELKPGGSLLDLRKPSIYLLMICGPFHAFATGRPFDLHNANPFTGAMVIMTKKSQVGEILSARDYRITDGKLKRSDF